MVENIRIVIDSSRVGQGLPGKGRRDLSGVMIMFSILMGFGLHRHLSELTEWETKFVHFTAYTFCHKRKETHRILNFS